MVERLFNGHKVRMYETIDELPVSRFHRFQKYLLIDSGVGADILAFDRRIEKMRRYMAQGKTELAGQEMQNLRTCVYLMQEGVSPKMRAFAMLVVSVDGKPFEDLSDTGADELLRLIDPSIGDAGGTVDAVKKK